jgi:hypothetical protein
VPVNLLSDESVFLADELRHIHWDGEMVCNSTAKLIYYGSRSERTAAIARGERAVVWLHPKTGEVRYPGRNDTPMPKYYQRAGYQRHEFVSLHDLMRFERERGVVNEAVHYDRGSGRAYDDADP